MPETPENGASRESYAAAELDGTVAVIGGGIAGITAAIKLFRQGYHVTLFEKSDVLGGNLSSSSITNIDNDRTDVYPHIFGDWYKEFWYLLEQDLGFKRQDKFVKRDKIKMGMIPPGKPGFKNFNEVPFLDLGTPTSLGNLLNNLNSKIMSKRDMFLFGYTYLNLASVPRGSGPSKVMNELDVMGYLYSQPYVNNNIVQFHDDILKVIWSMPADQTSAQAYQDLIRHSITFPNEIPFAWFMSGPIRQILMEPITEKLRKKFTGRSRLKLETEIKEISINKAKNCVCLKYEHESHAKAEVFRHVVVATQCQAAAKLVFSPASKGNLVSQAPSLARLREGVAGRIPVVYLYFTKTFLESERATRNRFPEELIGFKKIPAKTKRDYDETIGNEYDISIIDIKKLWGKNLNNANDGEPVFVVAASHAAAIQAPGPDEGQDNGEDQGFAMIRRLGEYLPFIDTGDGWGEGGDIDWGRTRVITNQEHLLFLNGAGTDAWRPRAKVDGLDNVFFAGDYCRTDVDMATVEAAVQSGVLAARAVQEKAGLGSRICLQPHDIYASRPFLLVKMLASPAAFAASLSESYDTAAEDPVEALKFPYVVAIQAAAYWVDWLRSAMLFWATFLPGQQWSASGAPLIENVADHDNRIGLAQWALNTTLAFIVEGPTLAPDPGDAVVEALYSAWYWTIGKALFPHVRATLIDPETKPAKNRAPTAPTAAPANTWSGLAREALGIARVTPKSLGDTAFGVATTVVSALQIATKTPSAKRRTVGAAIETGSLTFSDALKTAIKAGKEARQERAMSYRVYDAPYSLE